MTWLDLLNLGAQANTALATPESMPAQAPAPQGGVGPWAKRQGDVPTSYLDAYLKQQGVPENISRKEQRQQAPPPQPSQKTTPLAKGLGASGQTARGIDQTTGLAVQGVNAVAGATQHAATQATAGALEQAAAAEAAKATASGATSTASVGTTTTEAISGPVGWILMALQSTYEGTSGALKAGPKAKDAAQKAGKSPREARTDEYAARLHGLDSAAPSSKLMEAVAPKWTDERRRLTKKIIKGVL